MVLRRLLKKITPLRRAVRSTHEVLREFELGPLKRQLFGSKAGMVPPLRLMHDGPADYQVFKDNGEEFLNIFKDHCGLAPDAAILDVGSGIGRKTIPLTDYLTAEGRYEGIDIVRAGVRWCQKKISTSYPQFHFQHVDVYSKYYNPAGKIRPGEFRFPFQDALFDFVILTSVFTHMPQPDMAHYFDEIGRVLKRQGRCLVSYLLLNNESLSLRPHWTWDLLPKGDGSMVLREDDPEHLIAHPEELVRSEYARTNMRILRSELGSWCGRAKYLSFQDLILAEKL